MTKEQAEELASFVKIQFPFHVITVVEPVDKRKAPRNWLIGIKPSEDYTGDSLIIRSMSEWNKALLALHILRDKQ